LLLLRIVVGVVAAAQGATHVANADPATLPAWIVGVLAMASGALLLIGFLTPVAGATAGLLLLFIASSVLSASRAAPGLDGVGALCVAAVAAAIVLLGPGALSLDARLSGRREIVFPHDSHPPRF
jgi:uncharacterized membrane protein YphA (DoxX/SURF4 family)